MSKNWIQEAIKNPGALRRYIERNRSRIKRIVGEDPISKEGIIKISALKKLRKAIKEGRLRVSNRATLLRRINLAITLKRLRK